MQDADEAINRSGADRIAAVRTLGDSSSAAPGVSPASSHATSGAGIITSAASWVAKSKTLWSSSSWARGITPAPSASSTSASSSATLRTPSPATTSRTPNGRSNTSAERSSTQTIGRRTLEIISTGRATSAASVSARSSVSAFGTSSPNTADR